MCRQSMKILFLCFLMFFIHQSMLFAAEDEGYFLNLKQKGQLISLGMIQDHEGVWYNISICPGYVSPYRYAKRYFYETSSDFGEYFDAEKYRDLVKHSKDSFRWAFDDCIHDFIIEGVPKTWEINFQAADNRTKKRVFGWWFAYPWAFIESTVESVVRVPLGLTGSVLGTGVATVVVPTYHMTDSSVKGLWHLSVNTITLPIVAGTWNTIISPPLSIIGQKPSLDRVDGFWVKALSNEQVSNMEYLESSTSRISREDIVLLEQWGTILDTEIKPYENEYAQVRYEGAATMKKIREDQIERERKIKDEQKTRELKIREEESRHMEHLRTDPNKQQLLLSLSERGFTADRLRALRNSLRKSLQENGTIDEKQIDHLIDLLIKYPPSIAMAKGSQNNETQTMRDKTDPIRRSINTMKNVETSH